MTNQKRIKCSFSSKKRMQNNCRNVCTIFSMFCY